MRVYVRVMESRSFVQSHSRLGYKGKRSSRRSSGKTDGHRGTVRQIGARIEVEEKEKDYINRAETKRVRGTVRYA